VGFVDDLILRIRRGDSAPARAAQDVYRWAMRWNMPQSSAVNRIFGGLYRIHDAYEGFGELARGKLFYEPMFRARCHSVGDALHLSALPYVRGNVKITIGDDCGFGYFSVRSGRFVDEPELIIGDHSGFSTGCALIVNRRIRIGNHVGVAGRCWLSDSDGHPGDPERRMRGEGMALDDIKELVIEDHVWIGHGSHVLKGVTIGRGAVVAAGSTVTSDVPAGALAMGVPARIVKRPW